MSKHNIDNIKEAFSWTTKIAGTSWDPTAGRTPFNVVTGMGLNNSLTKGNLLNGELGERGDGVFPFPLDRIIDQLVITFEDLTKAKTTLLASLRAPTLTTEEKNLLRKDIKYINQCVKYIRAISKDVEKLRIGFK